MKARNIEAIFRLTPLQEGLLFHALDGSSHAYFDQFHAQLEGPIDTDLFRQAWQDTAASHGALRTFFTWEKRDHPLQVVRSVVEVPISVEDLSGLDEPAQNDVLTRYLKEDREAGFVLDQAPLVRVKLLQHSDTTARLIWSFHHLILDGWSVRLLMAEVQERYRALTSGDVFSAPAAPTFEQFVSWQRQRSSDDAERYWKNYLAGFDAPTTPRIAVDEVPADTEYAIQTSLNVPADLAARLPLFAREARVTLNTLFVAAWGLVLSRYCDSDDVVFGATSAGRPPSLSGVERTAGLFITTLPLRVNLEQHQDVVSLLAAIQSDQTRQREVDHVGLNVIQKLSDVAPGRPLFESLLVFENFPAFVDEKQRGFELHDEQFSEYSHYPLALLVVPGETTEIIAVHQPGVYSTVAVKRILDSVVTALNGLVTQTDIQSIDVLGREQLDNMRTLGRGTEISIEPASVLSEFERRVNESPDSIAVTTGFESFSYAQINGMAEQLAGNLSSRTSQTAVIYCQRNHWAIVSQLAALKAGKVYVTLDAKDPSSRVDFVIDDLKKAFVVEGGSPAPVLITASSVDLSPELQSNHEVLVVDQLVMNTPMTDSQARPVIDPQTAAYVIYTSGSTGTPKGVQVSHGSLTNSTLARNEFYPDSPSVFALLSSLATDSSIAGIYWTLCSGGTLVMPAERAELDVESLAQLFATQKVSHTLCVPSLYALMLDAFEESPCDSLEAIIVAGEACPLSLVKRHASLTPTVSLYNEYGPSEACVWVTADVLRGGDASVSIGRPIANTQVIVLDQQLRPVPQGVAGELCLSGANLADGYIGNPEANAESFVELPIAEGARYYRTGDKVVLHETGQLEYLGRIDNQLKVRGFRVEPGEVEAAMCLHEHVEAAVVLVDDSDLDSVLHDALSTAYDSHRSFLHDAIGEIGELEDQDIERALLRLLSPGEPAKI